MTAKVVRFFIIHIYNNYYFLNSKVFEQTGLHYIFRCPIWQLINCLHIIRFLSHHSQKKLKRIPAKNSLEISAVMRSDSLQRRTTVATLWLCRVRLPSGHHLYIFINFLCCQTQCPQSPKRSIIVIPEIHDVFDF